jgi:Xaa-Pro aminopeptidase
MRSAQRSILYSAFIGVLLLVPRTGAAQTESALGWSIPELAPPEPITAGEFAERRRAFMDALGDGVTVIWGARAPAQDYLPYQQNPAFRYLTGIEEPDAALVLWKQGERREERLFVLPRNPSREAWEGIRLGPAGAESLTGITAQPTDSTLAVLERMLSQATTLFALAALPEDVALDAVLDYEQQVLARVVARYPQLQVRPAGRELNALRARKSPAELDRLRRATYLTAEAHRQAMMATAPDMNEFEIRAIVEYTFLRHGGDGPGYASIVGSGPNSTTLHYNADDRCMNDGEVLLFDVATYYAGYSSDVTRTIPINGRFTTEQRSLYEVVLAAQKAAESQIREGARWQDLNTAATGALGSGLAKLGLIDAPDATYDCAGGRTCPQLRLFYFHGLGHGVGLEVHDPDISQLESFQPGSAVTIEPGLYVRADVFDHLPDTPGNRAMIERLRPVVDRYRNIGVRIEDVYIFDATGVERASRGVPREPDEVEALMQQPSPVAANRRADVVAWRCPRIRT